MSKYYEIMGSAEIIFDEMVEADNIKDAKEKALKELQLSGLQILKYNIDEVRKLPKKDFLE